MRHVLNMAKAQKVSHLHRCFTLRSASDDAVGGQAILNFHFDISSAHGAPIGVVVSRTVN